MFNEKENDNINIIDNCIEKQIKIGENSYLTGATCYLYRDFSLFCNAEVTAYPIRWLKSSELKS